MEQESSFSWIHGVSFCFSVGRHNVEAWYSSISGAERLSVDSKIVYSQRSFSANSSNTFDLDGVEYAVRLRVGSLFIQIRLWGSRNTLAKQKDRCHKRLKFLRTKVLLKKLQTRPINELLISR